MNFTQLLPIARGILFSVLLCSIAEGADQKEPAQATKSQTVTDANKCAQFEGPTDYTFEAVTENLPEGRSIMLGKCPDKSSMTFLTFERKTTEGSANEILDMVSEKFAKTTTPPKQLTLDGMPVLFRKFRMQGNESVITLQFAVFTGPTHYIVLMGTCPEAALNLRQPQFERAMTTLKCLPLPASKAPSAPAAK
jgi:hypothetical protein